MAIQLISPAGTRVEVPESEAEALKAQGFKPVTVSKPKPRK